MTVDPDALTSIIEGIFQINARLGDIAADVRSIRHAVEEDDDGEEEDDA
jgi:hypothetical protein